jgi:hypothetical protein
MDHGITTYRCDSFLWRMATSLKSARYEKPKPGERKSMKMQILDVKQSEMRLAWAILSVRAHIEEIETICTRHRIKAALVAPLIRRTEADHHVIFAVRYDDGVEHPLGHLYLWTQLFIDLSQILELKVEIGMLDTALPMVDELEPLLLQPYHDELGRQVPPETEDQPDDW